MFEWDISSNADRLVAFLLVCAILVTAFGKTAPPLLLNTFSSEDARSICRLGHPGDAVWHRRAPFGAACAFPEASPLGLAFIGFRLPLKLRRVLSPKAHS